MFGIPPSGLGGFGRPYLRDGRDWEAFSEVWETLPEVREELGGPPRRKVGVGRPSLRSRRC